MKAISLWQPWASAIALGAKRIETRSWSTPYRGPLAIHAARRCVKNELITYQANWGWCGALGIKMGHKTPLWEQLPFGAIVATCDLVDCRPTGSLTAEELDTQRSAPGDVLQAYQWSERQMGDFSLGRFGWVLDNIRALPKPIPYRGAQGFFFVPDALIARSARRDG
jgi:activating signal cointegrator 1